jgi:DNA-damage-inducible protein J
MATHTDKIQARIDPHLKASAEAIFAHIGLSMGEAIRLFFKQVQLHNGLPFEVRVPNADTLAAIQDADRNENLTTYHGDDDFKKSLGL